MMNKGSTIGVVDVLSSLGCWNIVVGRLFLGSRCSWSQVSILLCNRMGLEKLSIVLSNCTFYLRLIASGVLLLAVDESNNGHWEALSTDTTILGCLIVLWVIIDRSGISPGDRLPGFAWLWRKKTGTWYQRTRRLRMASKTKWQVEQQGPVVCVIIGEPSSWRASIASLVRYLIADGRSWDIMVGWLLDTFLVDELSRGVVRRSISSLEILLITKYVHVRYGPS